VQDRDEPTLELSLFAEAFQEMLVRDYGTQILNALYVERQASLTILHHDLLICPTRVTLRVMCALPHVTINRQGMGHALRNARRPVSMHNNTVWRI